MQHEKSCNKNPRRVSGYKHTDATRQSISNAGRGRSPSQETREKLSVARIKYLKANPDKVPYLLNHHRNGESYPEQYWRMIFTNAKLVFEQEKRVSIYQLDFAFNKKLNIEIDGEQHYVDVRILQSNRRRDEELRNLGWTVFRVRWSDFQKLSEGNKREFVDMVLAMIDHD